MGWVIKWITPLSETCVAALCADDGSACALVPSPIDPPFADLAALATPIRRRRAGGLEEVAAAKEEAARWQSAQAERKRAQLLSPDGGVLPEGDGTVLSSISF